MQSAGKVLIKCQDYFLLHPDAQPAAGHKYKLTDGTLETYEDIAEVAFGTKGRELISLILYTELLGTCALFLILQKGVFLSISEVPLSMVLFRFPSRCELLPLSFACASPTAPPCTCTCILGLAS